MRRFALLLLGILAGAFALAGPAFAHATVEGSTPADGARLASAPAAVTVRFDESVGIAYVHVTDRRGQRVETGSASHPGGASDAVRVALRTGLGDGSYTVSFRVLSADSHPVAGTISFVVGNGPLVPAPSVTPASPSGVGTGLDAARWVSMLGVVVLGGVWLVFAVWPAGRDDRRARAIVWTGWTAAVLGAVAEILLQGVNAAGAPLTSAFDPSLVDDTLHTSFGQWHCMRLVLLGAVAVLLGRALQPSRQRVLSEDALLPLGLGIAGSFAISGHPRTTEPAWLSISADTLHLAAVAGWVGGLVMLGLAVLPRRDTGELVEVLPVFSRVAFTSVVVIAVTGTYAAWRGIGSWRALFETSYGLLVLAKVAGFVVLIALGNLSRLIIQRRVRHRPVVAYAMSAEAAPEPGLSGVDVERLRRGVVVEIVVAVVVLALAAVLVGRPRGSDAIAAADREPVTATAAVTTTRTASLTVDPGRHGVVSLTIDLGAGAAPASVTASATQPAAQLGPIPLHLVRAGAGSYSAAGVDLPVAGTWMVALVITWSQFSAVTTELKVTLS